MSHINFKIFTGTVLRLLDLFFREQINFSENKLIFQWSNNELV